MSTLPRLRMFAGPNGSGKSTLKSVIRPELLGIYINPDEIEQEIRLRDFLDMSIFRVETTESEIITFFNRSTLLDKADLLDEAACLHFSDNKLSFFEIDVNAYFASVAADFIRRKLLDRGVSFTFGGVAGRIPLLWRGGRRSLTGWWYVLPTKIGASRYSTQRPPRPSGTPPGEGNDGGELNGGVYPRHYRVNRNALIRAPGIWLPPTLRWP